MHLLNTGLDVILVCCLAFVLTVAMEAPCIEEEPGCRIRKGGHGKAESEVSAGGHAAWLAAKSTAVSIEDTSA